MSSAAHRHIVAAGYNQIADAYLAWSTDSPVRDQWVSELHSLLSPNARVLDLGCGAGIPVARRLAEEGYRVVGIDGSAEQIDRARRNVPEGIFEIADMIQVDFNPGSFDAVLALYSITHVPRTEHARLLRRIRRWLKPGGLLLACLGAGDTPDWTGEWLGTTMFFSHFDAETNRSMLNEAGFEIDRAEIVSESEDGVAVDFLWVIARTLP